MLRKLIALASFALACSLSPVQAQPVKIVASCGTVSPAFSTAFQSAILTMDVNGNLCTAASVSASISGFPTVQSTGTPIAVTTGGVTGTLPAGAVVVASNVGATNGAYCKLGASATTSDQLIPPNSWFAFTVGANTQLTCITSALTTTVNMVGGSGLPTGSGGGGGGGGGGAVTNAGTFAVQVTADSTAAALLAAVSAAVPACGATPCVTTIGNTGQLANVGGTDTKSIKCGSSIVYDASTSGSTQLVALSGSTSVYVCGYTILAGGTVNVKLITGTGTACVTGAASITPAYQLTAQTGVADGANEYRGLKGAASSELCLNTSAGVAVQAIVYYTQF
jgi:hypothetical protein